MLGRNCNGWIRSVEYKCISHFIATIPNGSSLLQIPAADTKSDPYLNIRSVTIWKSNSKWVNCILIPLCFSLPGCWKITYNTIERVDAVWSIPYHEPVYTGWSSVHWNATGMPLVDPVYTGIPLDHPANTCRVHWNTTGKTYLKQPHWNATGET